MDEYDGIPVVWTKHGDGLVAVTTTERPVAGWTELLSPNLERTLVRLTGGRKVGSGMVQTRIFTMRDVDLKLWDTATRKGSDGYSYGVVWGDDNKFLKNLQFKELAPAETGAGLGQIPPIDPATMALVAAMHQVQQTLERLEGKVDQILAVVEWLEERRQSRRAAELLTAVAALDSVARRCFTTGRVDPEDLFRIGHLEQVVGTVHRDICAEIEDLAVVFSYHDVRGARRACDMGPGRVADLVRLDGYALAGLKAWHQLMLLSKATNGRIAENEVSTSRQELAKLVASGQRAVNKFDAVRTRMSDRSIWEYMSTTGIPKGRADDRSLRKKADAVRADAQRRARRAGKKLDALESSLLDLDVILPGSRAPLHLLPAQAAANRPGTPVTD